MRIAAVQHDIAWEDGAATRGRVAPMIADAAGAGARLVVLTEMYSTGFSMNIERTAEPPGGASESFLVEQAAEHGCWLAGSIAQREPGQARARNVAVVVSPDGSVRRYAKIHPFGYSGEDRWFEAGREFLTLTIDGLRISVFVCYDLRFADEFWSLAHETDCYLVVANWPASRRTHWRTLLRARAIENQAYVVAANRVGSGGGLEYSGDSAIIDPFGTVLATGSGAETILYADVSPERVAQVRTEFPFLADRR
jgi:predicted amidohydrolase